MHGTNNLPDCSNMCHESGGRALVDSIGIGKGTVTLDDFNAADRSWSSVRIQAPIILEC